MPRRSYKHNKGKVNKRMEHKRRIATLKKNPPPPDLLLEWLMKADIKALDAVKRLGLAHLINEPFKYHPDEPPNTPFLMMCCHNGVPIYSIEWMIENGADLRAKDGYGATAMHYAVAGRCPETLCALWRTEEKDWLLNEPNCDGETPMQLVEKDLEQITLEQHCRHLRVADFLSPDESEEEAEAV